MKLLSAVFGLNVTFPRCGAYFYTYTSYKNKWALLIGQDARYRIMLTITLPITEQFPRVRIAASALILPLCAITNRSEKSCPCSFTVRVGKHNVILFSALLVCLIHFISGKTSRFLLIRFRVSDLIISRYIYSFRKIGFWGKSASSHTYLKTDCNQDCSWE